MSTHSLRALRENLGNVVRGVVADDEEAIITDNGTEIAAIIPIGRLRELQAGPTNEARVAAVQRFNESRGLRPTPEGLAAMRARLEEFAANRRAGRADAA
jgi:prevent-host-death family protein